MSAVPASSTHHQVTAAQPPRLVPAGRPARVLARRRTGRARVVEPALRGEPRRHVAGGEPLAAEDVGGDLVGREPEHPRRTRSRLLRPRPGRPGGRPGSPWRQASAIAPITSRLVWAGKSRTGATTAIALYVIYNVAATITSFPAGGLSDKLGRRGPLLVTAAGVAAFLVSYLVFAASGPLVLVLGVAFALAGVGIGCAETAEHAAVAAFAPTAIRGSAFGLLATVQALGNVAASAIAGLLYTFASPTVAFLYLGAWMLIALAMLAWAARTPTVNAPAAR